MPDKMNSELPKFFMAQDPVTGCTVKLQRVADIVDGTARFAIQFDGEELIFKPEAELLAVCRAEQTGPGPTAPDGPSERQA